MTETKYFRDAFRDQLHELSGQPNKVVFDDEISHYSKTRITSTYVIINKSKHFEILSFICALELFVIVSRKGLF